MTLSIIGPGLLTTLQDLGRHGYQRQGIVVSGAMDSSALRIANLLVGNSEREAALEITLAGPVLQFHKDTVIAICGGDLSASCLGHRLPLWRPLLMRRGTRLEFGKARSGCRAYLAVAGGFAVEPILGSKSTYLRGNLGGYQGRALQNGDVLAFGPKSEFAIRIEEKLQKIASLRPDSPFSTTGWQVSRDLLPAYRNNPTVRVVKGRQFEVFTKESRQQIFSTAYQVTPQSDRMGYRLQSVQGAALTVSERSEMISEAVAFGTIQIPPEGQPIVLMADRQTTGGYPKIAEVITVDLPVLAQMKPGESVRFIPVEVTEAQELYRMREWEIGLLGQGILLER